MATINPVSASLRLTLDLGSVAGKPVTKSVSVSRIGSSASADALAAVSAALGSLLAHSVTETKKYSTGLLVA